MRGVEGSGGGEVGSAPAGGERVFSGRAAPAREEPVCRGAWGGVGGGGGERTCRGASPSAGDEHVCRGRARLPGAWSASSLGTFAWKLLLR